MNPQEQARRADRELALAEERFRTFFDNAPIGKCMTAADGTLLRVNPAFGAMLGYTAEEMQSISFSSITHPEDIAESRECIRALVAGERDTWVMQKRYLAKDGRHVWTHVTTRLQRDADGKPLHFLTHIQDISESKVSEKKLRESEARFRQLAESLPQLIWTCQADGPCDYLSPQWVAHTGVPEADQLGYRWLEQLHPDDRERVIGEWSATAPRGDAFDIEFRIRRHDGVHRSFRTRAVPLRDEHGNVLKWLGSNTDVEDMRKANEALARSNRELEQFAYVASHDLQEPLRMVSSYTQLLARRYQDKLDQDANDFIAYAVDGANRMQRLIQDLLTYSRVTTRGLAAAPMDAHEALGEAVRNLQAAIQQAGALVTNEELPEVLGDRTQIAQVFQNLVGNGIKFHKPGQPPRVHISAQRCAEQPAMWTFTVRDNGIGIEHHHFERLFVIFQRLHGKKEYPGTGIGLALCKRIVERHGGTIWLESEPGEGTTFLFTLPGAAERAGARP